MLRSTTLRLPPVVAVALLALHVAHDLSGFGGPGFDAFFAAWFQPVAFLGCGALTLARAGGDSRSRAPWLLLGGGLVFYAGGSVYYNLAFGGDATPPFPSLADALWLTFYPLALAGIVVLARRRLRDVGASVWLDGAIAGSVVAAVVAALVFQPVFEVTADNGAASLARLGYPVGDLISVGFVVAVWSLCGRRLEPFWALLGTGFALLAAADSVYVVQAAQGAWAPGGLLDLPYAAATMLLATAAWVAPRTGAPAPLEREPSHLLLATACGLTALGLVSYAVFVDLNPLATTLSLATLLAVVLRLGSTLGRLNRQRVELAARAASDPLTGLANHRTVHERLAAEIERSRAFGAPLSVVALDIDHFKAINDTYGHTAGDGALQEIAREIAAQARAGDLVGRVGGEEFALVLPGASAEDAFAIAERCRAALAELAVEGTGISCSAGVASYPLDDPDGMRLLELADGALYWAKRAGRAQTRHYDAQEVVLLSTADQRAQVQSVLDRPEAITPVFQPIVELATGRVAGYEALTRFPHEEPLRSPDRWFAQARRCGLGGQLEARAIEVALAVAGRPAGTFLSLNVSPAALLSPEVQAALPGDLGDIVIELTEDEVFSKDEALDVALDDLRSRGARIAVDDAGAGYAGLQQLIRIKPEILKLDRSLISGVDADASKIALLEALARFASSTGTAVCGEGIETVEELRMLARVDTTYAQGYSLGRPGPAWPGVDEDVVAGATAVVSMGMRLALGPSDGDEAPINLGEVAETLARVRSRGELDAGGRLLARLLHCDEVVISKVLANERCVETLSAHDWTDVGERYGYDDYPTTEHVAVAQVIGQLIEGDPAADPAELRLLAEQGYRALLMAPVVYGGETVGLLELYRRAARPWTGTEIDQARLLAHRLGAAVHRELRGAAPWTPETVLRQQEDGRLER